MRGQGFQLQGVNFAPHVVAVSYTQLDVYKRQGLPMEAGKPRQIEFSRLNFNYLVMSKRKLMALVTDKLVDGWDDPRMPTLQGIRRRGYTASALKLMVERVGISKQNSLLDISILEGALRDDLDAHAPRRMAVIDPLKVVLTNLDADFEENLTFANHPKALSLIPN